MEDETKTENRYDPKLKEAMARIEKICEEYNCGAYVSLTSETHGEFRFVLPKWGVMFWEKDEFGNTTTLRLKTVNMKTDPRVKRAAELTSHFVYGTLDTLASAFQILRRFQEVMQEKWNVKHDPFAGYRAHKENEN